jgi:hypothetical protein
MSRLSRRSFLASSSMGAGSAPFESKTAPTPSVRVTEDIPIIDEADICVLGGTARH